MSLYDGKSDEEDVREARAAFELTYERYAREAFSKMFKASKKRDYDAVDAHKKEALHYQKLAKEMRKR